MVSILILLDTGWKAIAGRRISFHNSVSILILLDTGWKFAILFPVLLTNGGFNPHLTGYGLEGTDAFHSMRLIIRFNPHLTGYGLEEM